MYGKLDTLAEETTYLVIIACFEIDKITLPYTTKANTFSLFRWWEPCDT